MGARIFSIFIKTDALEKFPLKKIAAGLFQNSNIKLNEYGYSLKNLTVIRYKSGIKLSNADLTLEVLENQNENWIKKIYTFFEEPELIMAYMMSEYNNAAGYSVIEKGKIVRYRFFDPGDEKILSGDFGEPYNEEIESLEKISKENFFDIDKQMSFAKMYYTGKIEFYHDVNFMMVEKLIAKFLGFEVFGTIPDKIDYGYIEFNKSTIKF